MSESGLELHTGSEESEEINISVVDLLKSAGKFAIKLGTGAFADAAAEIPDVVEAFNIKSAPDQRIKVFITRSLERSLKDILASTASGEKAISREIYAASFLGLTDNITFTIDSAFFARPNVRDLVDKLTPDIRKWLSAVNIPEQDIHNVLHRFPNVIIQSMHDEWRSNNGYYIDIFKAIESPFSGAAFLEDEWSRYRSFLILQSQERVFDETFGLDQIYIPHRAYFSIKKNDVKNVREFIEVAGKADDQTRQLIWAQEEIITWIKKEDKDLAIRTVTGGPGSGKSSFAKILASKLAQDGAQVLFVPLHQVDLDSGVSRAVGDYFIQTNHFTSDPLSLDLGKTLILILDGLDEIQMQGRAAQEVAQSFVNDLNRFVDRKNSTRCNILCLLTGRDLAVQSAEGALKAEGQVLHLEPYAILNLDKHRYIDELSIKNLDQRDDWWKAYGKLTGSNIDAIPASFKKGEMNEVTSQPLLNYLVALSYNRGLVVDETTNINVIYRDLLDAVYKRGWARHGHPSVEGITQEAFVRLLEEVALAVWHGAGRTTTLAEVEHHCQQSHVGPLLSSFQRGVSSGISSLLLAFYFRQKGRRESGEKTFEFTHKTFAEYLISLRVVRLVKLLCEKTRVYKIDPDNGIDSEDALHKWLLVCGQTPIDAYLQEFIAREISALDEVTTSMLQDGLCDLLSASVSKGWPIQRIQRLSFGEQQIYARNAEETLLACLNACAKATRKISMVKWPNSTAAGEMLRRLQGQRKGPGNRPCMNCLSDIDFSNQCFDMADFYKANLRGSKFDRSQLNYACLMLADVSGASFVDAALQGANLSNAVMDRAVFSFSDLEKFEFDADPPILLNRVNGAHSKIGRVRRQEMYAKELSERGARIIDSEGKHLTKREISEKIQARAASNSTNSAGAAKIRKSE